MGNAQMGTGSLPFTGEITLGFATFYDLDGTLYFLAVTDAAIYKYDSSANTWTAVTIYEDSGKSVSNIVAEVSPATVTAAGHGLSNDDVIYIVNVVGDMGTDVVNGAKVTVSGVAGNDFNINVNTSGKTYTSGGRILTAQSAGGLSGSINSPISMCHMPDGGGAGIGAADYWLVISNGVDPIMYWAGGSADILELIDTDNSTHIARQVFSYKESLLGLGADSEPHKIIWSNTGTINNFAFTTTSAGFLYLYDTPGEIQWGGMIGDNVGVAKDDSLGLLSYTGGTTLFRYDTMVRGIGAIAPGMIAVLRDYWLVFAKENIFRWTGGTGIVPVGNNVIGDILDVSTGVNWSAINASRVLVDKTNTRANFYLPTAESSYADKNYVYNWKENVWEIDDLVTEVTAVGSYSSYSMTTWASWPDGFTWADLGVTTWAELAATEGANVPVVGDEDGYVYQQSMVAKSDGATAIDQIHETIDFVPDGEEYQNRWVSYVGIFFDAKGDSVTIEYSTDAGSNWTSIDTQSLTAEWTRYKQDFRTTARKIRFRLRNNSLGSNYYCRQLGVRAIPRGIGA